MRYAAPGRLRRAGVKNRVARESDAPRLDAGGERAPRREGLPADAQLVLRTPAWDVYVSTAKKCAIISVGDYHQGLLYLSADDIGKLLRQLEPA